MSKKIKDLAVKTGTYQAGGATKNRYENIGSLMQSDDGSQFIIMKRTFNPAGVPNPENKDSVLVSVFDLKDSGVHSAEKVSSSVVPPLEDSVPF